MPFRNWRYRNIHRGGRQLHTSGCGCTVTLFCTNGALVKHEAQIAAPSRARSSPTQAGGTGESAESVSPSEGSVQPPELVRPQAGPCSCHPVPEHGPRQAGTQDPPPGSQPGVGQTLLLQSDIEQCLLGIALGSFWAISPCKHKTHSAQVVSAVDQESMGSFMSRKPCAHAICSFGSGLEWHCCAFPAPGTAAFTLCHLREVCSTRVNINKGNILAPLRVQGCKWYFYLLLSISLFIRYIRKSIKEEIRDLMTCTVIRTQCFRYRHQI